MASIDETLAIARTLLALSDAVSALGAALEELAPTGNETLKKQLNIAHEDVRESMEHLRRLVTLIENGDG